MISSKRAASDFNLLNGAKVRENSKANPMKSPKFIDEAIEATKQLRASINFKGPLDEKVEELYCKARAGYENAIFVDNESSEFYDDQLWLLHYGLIEAFRCRIKACCQSTSGSGLANPQNPRILQENCIGILTGFQNFLAKSTKFYVEMISKLREYFGIPEECSIDSCAFLDGLESKVVQKFQLLCHRCLIYLGDLGRYKELYSSPEIPSFNLSISTHYYLNAASVYPASGNPHNQLALLAMYIGDELQQMYHFVRSLAIADPFHKAWDNLFLLFDKLMHTPLREASLEKKIKGSGASHSDSKVCEAAAMNIFNEASFMEAFGYPFTKLISVICTNSRMDGLSDTYAATLIGLERVLFVDDAKLEDMLRTCQPVGIEETKNSAFRIIQIVCILIFAIWCQNLEFKFVRCERDRQKDFIQLAWSAAFDIMGHMIHRCVKYSSVNDSPLLPGVLVFVEWSALRTDLARILDEADEKCANAASYFFSFFVDMLNKVCDKGDISHQSSGAYKLSDNDILWEDSELWTFSPLLPIHGSSTGLNSIPGKKPQLKHESQVRNSRMVASAFKLVNIFSTSSCNWIRYNETEKRFYAFEAGKENEKNEHGDDIRLPGHDSSLISAVKEDVELASECTGTSKKTNTSYESCIGEEDEVIIFNPGARNNSNADLVYSPEASDFIILHSEAPGTTSSKPTQESKLNDCHSTNAFSASLGHTEVSRTSQSDGVDFRNGEGTKSARLLTADSVLHSLYELSISSTSTERDQTGHGLLHPKNYALDSGSLPSRIASPSLCGWIVSKEKDPALPESLASDSSSRAGWSPLKDIHAANTTSRDFPESSSLFSMPLPSPNTPIYSSHLNFENPITGVPEYFSATFNPYVSPLPSAPVLTEETIIHGNSPATYPREYVDSSLGFSRHFPVSSAPQDLLGESGTASFVGSSSSSDKLRNWFLAQGLQGTSPGYGGNPYATALPPIYYFHQYRDIFSTRHGDDLYYPSYYDPTFKELDILKKSSHDSRMNPSGPTLSNFYDGSYRDLSIPHSYNAIDQRGKEVMFYGYQSAAPVRYGSAWDQRTEHLLHSQYPTDSEWYRQRQHV